MTTTTRTEEHSGPKQSERGRGRTALVVAFPESKALPLPLAGEAIGREWLARHGIADSRVSTRHVVFTRPGGTLFVEDVGSRNGTWVDGVRLVPNERVAIRDGSLLRIGRVLLVFRDDLIGTDAPMPPIGAMVGPFGLRRVRDTIDAIAARQPKNVLIEGETGAGKELVARAVAEASGRAHKYAPINVAGVAAGVFESQLFGYVAGAYSGGGRGSPGVFVAHDGGAVFLDEIGELPLDLQAKLLRVLDNREVLPVGGVRPTVVDVLVISATNRALEDAVEQGTFRRDLLARLAAARIDLPALRDRAEDLFAIMQALLAKRGEAFDPARVEVEAVERLMLHPWPSNIREVASVVERVAMLEPPPRLRLESVEQVLGPLASGVSSARSGPLTTETIERAIAEAGSESAAARKLGVSRGKLRRARGSGSGSE